MPRTIPGVSALSVLIGLAACGDPVGPPDSGRPELIAFSSNPAGVAENVAREIFVMKPDGSDVVQLTTGMFATAPAWSPDGTMIAFSTLLEGDRNIYVMNADGSNLRAVTTGPVAAAQPSWSPDGTRIVFTRLEGEGQLYSVGVDGSDLTLLHDCEFGCHWATWSPSGSRLAFVGWPGDTHRSPLVHLLGMDGSPPAPLGEGFTYSHLPSWSPDGTRLVFVGNTGMGPFDLFTASPDGTNATRLASDRERREAAFSRDGSSIVFYQSDGDIGIYVMNTDGSDARRILGFPDRHAVFVTPRWRP